MSFFKKNIPLEPYPNFAERLPQSGKHIIATQTEDQIIIYQAYKPSIATYAVAHQQFGGSNFSYNRMSWIKPNFLWMMYRCGWAAKENQEHVLAIWIKKEDWETILKEAVHSSYQEAIYKTEANWKQALSLREVRLQWDPAHDPYGAKLTRKAIQIGMKGEILQRFGKEMIQHIEDITEFVKKQKQYVDQQQLAQLEVPKETIFISKAANIYGV